MTTILLQAAEVIATVILIAGLVSLATQFARGIGAASSGPIEPAHVPRRVRRVQKRWCRGGYPG